MGTVLIRGGPMDRRDRIDLTTALAGVAGWDHNPSDMGRFVTIGSSSLGTNIKVNGRTVVVVKPDAVKGSVLQYLTAN
jgi:hypothetical protein